ncbi:hypothetical protein Dimus_001010 [Dionaea muscipula]
MDFTYMEYLLTRKLVNLPRVIIRHMGYVIDTPHYELPYGELLTKIFHAFDVPLNDKEAEQPVKTHHYDETFLGIDEEEDNPEESEEEVEEIDSEETDEDGKYGESTPVGSEGEHGESKKEVNDANADTVEEFFDVEDGGKATDEDVTAPIAQPDLK